MKRFLALLLALMMVVSLAACGGGEKDTNAGQVDENVEIGRAHV